MTDHNSRSSQQRSQGSGTHSALSPHSSAHASSASSGRALRLHNLPKPPAPQPVAYPTPVRILKGPHDLAEAEPYGYQAYNPYEASEDVQELGEDHDYDYIDAEEIVEMDQYPERPRQVRRESQDVEFGNRVSRAGSRRHGWEVNVRMPRIREMSKGLSREKAKTLLHSLKVPQNLSNLKSFRSLKRAHTVSHPSAPFEFRDSQPVPQSIRQQYAELTPSDGVVHKSEDGFLAPPPSGPAPVSMLDVELRRSRSQSESHYSQNTPQTTSHRPRSHSVGSQQSRETLQVEGTTVAHHTGSTQTHGETTVVHDSSDPVSLYTPPRSQLSRRTYARTSHAPKLASASNSTTLSSLGSPRYKSSSSSRYGYLAPVVRALQRLQRLPWIAQPSEAPGAFMPSGPAPRVAADFVPAVHSARSRFRVPIDDSAAARDRDAAIRDPSWYQPKMKQKQLQRALRAQHAPGVGGGVNAVASAYQNYFAAARKHGRPLGYMYAPPSSRSVSSFVPVSAPMSYLPHSRSASTGSNYAYSYTAQPGYVHPSALGPSQSQSYSGSSGYASQNTSQGSYSSSMPPPVPPKQPQVQPQYYIQQQPQAMYRNTGPLYGAPAQSAASSPPLPSLPSFASYNSNGNGSGISYGSGIPPPVPAKYVQYSYSYI